MNPPPVNAQRGDGEVVLDGTTYPLRLSFEAIAAIEGKCGPIVPLGRRLGNFQYSALDVHAILAAGIAAAGQKVPDDLGARILAQGILPVGSALLAFLTPALSGSRRPERGNAEAPAGNANQTAT